MAEGYKSYRIRTKVGQEAPNVVNVHLDQTYDEFQILSLKIDQKNSYKLYQSDKGIVVGRVLANGGVGVSNAKVSIFIETDDTMGLDKHILYPYSSVNDINDDRIRYNLLPDYIDETCHQNVGTFPNKRLVLDNDDVIEVFDRFWKYTTVTNSAGDFMLYGIPTGNHTLHMDVDLSDIGLLSQKPRDLAYKGYNMNLFESPTKFKKDTNLNSLAQIKSQDIGVFVYPFWGDTTDNGENIAVTRCDIQVDYKFEPTCIFMGSIITDTGSNAIGKNCAGTDGVGKMSDLVSGEGSIEMIRKTIDNKVEEFQIKGNRVIDGDGVWCYQIPMNLDYVMTDEFGNLVPTDNPDKGIPTRARVRFRISLDDPPSDNTARKRCKYLVPNNPRIDADRFPVFTSDTGHLPDYEFGTNTREESFCDLFWNKVYTVKNYIPRLQKNSKVTNRKHTGIKLVNHYGDNNPFPYNNLSIKLSFTYRFICVLTKIFIKLVGFLNNIITILGAIPCKIAEFFREIADFFNFKILGWRPLSPVASLFYSVAKFFEILSPPCIAISSQFCTGDVTHAYTFYPGCGQKGLGNLVGPLADCVWKRTKELFYAGKLEEAVEDKTEPINNDGELYNCVESQLAEDNEATSFNFENDWINGTLYAPLWYRYIRPKRKFLFGLFSRSAKDEWCSADNTYEDLLRIFQPCAVQREAFDEYTNHNGKKITPYIMRNNPDCDTACDERKKQVDLSYGVIRDKQTMLGQTVYYYKPVEFELGNDELAKDEGTNGTLKILFASDIVLLGSLNECDLNGVPQFFKSLESSTYKLPPNMLFTDNTVKQNFNEDGTISTHYDIVSTSEMTGNDWGNGNDDICDAPDGGLFYDIGCNSTEMIPKSCINLSRICEFGASLDETKQIPTLSQVKVEGDNAFKTLVPDGFISKDELYNDNERSMFATMNGNELLTKLNTENGLKEYDFRHLYVDNFDKSLYEVMRLRQTRCQDYTYKNNYHLEDFSAGYYDFRMGKNPFFYQPDYAFPRYENSFYFYFGLKVGKTAIDKFNSQFFAECYNSEEALSPIGIETQGNTWCSEANGTYDGFVKIDLSQIALPCDILIQDNLDSSNEFHVEDVKDEKVIIANNEVAPYVKLCEVSGNESICYLKNGSYTMTVTDVDGEINSIDFDLRAPYLKYNTVYTNFKLPENVLLEKFPETPSKTTLERIAEDRTGAGLTDFKDTREIGGTITIKDIKDGFSGAVLDSYTISIVPSKKIVFVEDNPDTTDANEEKKYSVDIKIENNIVKETSDYWVNRPTTNPIIIGVPKGDEYYNISITQWCQDKNGTYFETNNRTSQTVFVGNITPYKLYINDIIDYDVIRHWGTGYKLTNTNDLSNNEVSLSGGGTYFDSTKFSDNWLNMSDRDGTGSDGRYRYLWDKLISYQKCLDNINKCLKDGSPNEKFTNKVVVTAYFPIGNIKEINGVNCLTGILVDKKEDNDKYYGLEYFIKSINLYKDTTDIDEQDANRLMKEIIQECEKIIQIKEEFVIQMKSTFWLTCPKGSKDISFRATTDYMPVAFYIAHRTERLADEGFYNILENDENGKLYFSFNEERRIDDITIPSLSTVDSEAYGLGDVSNQTPYIVNSNVSLALDNRSGYSIANRQKYAFFVGVINSSEQTTVEDEEIPSGDTVPTGIRNETLTEWNKPNTSQLFGFHVIDKITDVRHISWAYIRNIPYFNVKEEDKKGQFITTYGLFAGKMYNGVAKVGGDVTEFTTQKLGRYNISIKTPSTVNGNTNTEDTMPTFRYINGSNAPDSADNSYYTWKNYKVYNPDNTTLKQYVPLLSSTSKMEIEDSSYCSIVEDIYGGMRITLSSDSVDNCEDRSKSVLHVTVNNASSEKMAFFMYKLGDGDVYPLNYFNLPAQNSQFSTIDKVIQDNQEFVANRNDETYKLFSISVDKINLIKESATNLFETVLEDESEEVTVCKYFGINEDDTYNSKTISSNGVFKRCRTDESMSVYIVARTENECRAISPVYSFVKIYGGIIMGTVKTKLEQETEGGGTQFVTEDIKYAAFYITDAKNHYYLDCFNFSIHAKCELDQMHTIESTSEELPNNGKVGKTIMFVEINDETYSLLEQYIINSEDVFSYLRRKALANVTAIEVIDVTGLKHLVSIDASASGIYRDKWYAISYDPNGGYWSNPNNTDDKSDTSIKTDFVQEMATYKVCKAFGVPKPLDEDMTFDGWAEISSPSTIIECDTEITDKQPKIYIAKWKS